MADAVIDNKINNKVCVPEHLKDVFSESKLPPCDTPINQGFKPAESIAKSYSPQEIAHVQGLLNQTVRAGDNLKVDGQAGVYSKTETAMTQFADLYNIDHPSNKIDPANKKDYIAALEDAAKRGTYRIEK